MTQTDKEKLEAIKEIVDELLIHPEMEHSSIGLFAKIERLEEILES